MSSSGIPAEIVLYHGSYPDISAFNGFSLHVSEVIIITNDKEYNDYSLEDSLT